MGRWGRSRPRAAPSCTPAAGALLLCPRPLRPWDTCQASPAKHPAHPGPHRVSHTRDVRETFRQNVDFWIPWRTEEPVAWGQRPVWQQQAEAEHLPRSVLLPSLVPRGPGTANGQRGPSSWHRRRRSPGSQSRACKAGASVQRIRKLPGPLRPGGDLSVPLASFASARLHLCFTVTFGGLCAVNNLRR